ncbi:MAG: SusC/RagA family TonB-linked outer membrane protein, partial [Bacteroides sp.]
SGEPIIGASIVVIGTSQGTITDVDGNFTLPNVAEGASIEVTYIGYISQTLKATAAAMNFILKEDSQALEEVVVIGYGVQKKSVVTASIAKVGEDVLTQTSPMRMDNALKGLAAGVQVSTQNGQPGSASKIRVRGTGTINNSDPLYIVDGMPIDGGLDNINPADIQSIEVLKDAASGAVYGTRAANGVVLVTTKRGKMGKPQVSYDFSYGWQSAWRKRDMLNASQYAELMNEALAYAGESPRFSNTNLGAGTNWQEALFNDGAPVQNHQLSVSGATEKVNYYFSAGYYNQEGIIGGNYDKSNYERLSFRSNTQYTLFDESKTRNWLRSLTFSLNMSYSRINSIGVTAGSLTGSPLGDALLMDPTLSVYADSEDQLQSWDRSLYGEPVVDQLTGKLLAMPSSDFNELANPLARISAQPGTKNNSDKFIANLSAELGIWDNLKYKFSWGSDLAFWGNDGWSKPFYLNKNATNSNSNVWSQMNRGYTWQIENVLTYDKSFGKHSFNVVLGQSAQRYTSRQLGGSAYDMIEYNPDKANLNFTTGLASDGKRDVYGGAGDPHSLASYFGRLSYNYDERYMLQATVRRDGSSRFGSNNKWATFPSVSLGWNLTNESFMQNRPSWLTSTKLRLSWGKNGNENIGNFLYTVNTSTGNNYVFGAGANQTILLGSKPSGTPNPDLKWEESEQTDLGVDFGFFDNALTLTIDYYKKKTNGMLKTMAIPSYLGESLPWGNVGSMENSGVEIELGYKYNRKDFRFGVSANVSYLKNKLINLGNADGFEMMDHVHIIGNVSRAENGQPYPYFYGYLTDGILQNQAEADAYNAKYGTQAVPGDVRFVDFDENGTINDQDKTKIGKGTPDWTYGVNFTAGYKNLDFSMLVSGVLGQDILDVTRRLDCRYVNLPAEFINRWHGEGTSNSMPRFTFTNNNDNYRISDLYVKNGNYLRIKNIQLGYTLPKAWTQQLFVQRLRLYVAAENLLTLTSYKGLDPELGGDEKSNGIDRGYYPQPRTFTVGLNLTF